MKVQCWSLENYALSGTASGVDSALPSVRYADEEDEEQTFFARINMAMETIIRTKPIAKAKR